MLDLTRHRNWAGLGLTLVLSGCVGIQHPKPNAMLPAISRADAAAPSATPPVDAAPSRPPLLVPGQNIQVGSPDTAKTNDGGFVVNLFDAELSEATRVVFGDLLDAPFTIDPTVQGRVTISASSPISREDLLALFETSLRQNGAVLINQGDRFRVASTGDAQGGGRLLNQHQAGYGVTAIQLKFIGADTARTLLEGTVLRQGAVRAEPSRNLLVVVGSQPERSAAADALAAFDVDWIASMSIGVFPIENADPQTIVGELETLLQSGQGGTSPGAVRLRPLARLNSILAVVPSAGMLEQIRAWIARLDIEAEDTAVLRTYFLDSGKAEETAKLLSELLAGQMTRQAPVTAPGDTGVTGVTPGLGGNRQTPFSPPASNSEPRIIADKLNNALLVLAEPAGHKLVQRALKDIDRQPPQVLVDATIVEVTLSDRLRYGVQWFFETNGIKGLADSGRGGLSSGNKLDADGTFPGFNLIFESADMARLAIDALGSITNVTVRSAPSLMVMDNQSATLRVGDRVPVVTRQATNVDTANAPLINQVEFQETGVILNVSPRVSSTSVVTLEIDQEVSSVSDTVSTGTLTPTISQRRIKSTVAVRSGQTLVLGGLIDETRGKSRTGMPWISDVPLLGNLFSSTDKNARRTELIIFLTPRVLRNDDEMHRAATELRDRMDSIAREDERVQRLAAPGKTGEGRAPN